MYMSQGTGSAIAEVMACYLFGVKPSSKAMLAYCQLDPLEINKTSVKRKSKYKAYLSWKQQTSMKHEAKHNTFL